MRTSVLCALALGVGCTGPVPARLAPYFPPSVVYEGPYFVARGKPVATLELSDYAYELTLEASPSAADLHAVLVTGKFAFAFGDEGTILVRAGGDSPWRAVVSPTERRLWAVTKRAEKPFVVGERGAWLKYEAEDRWTLEDSGTEHTLYAVISAREQTFAVGEHGTLVQRDEHGGFTQVPTRTEATLRDLLYVEEHTGQNAGESLRHLVLVGDAGTLIDCALRVDPPACIPRVSPSPEDLLQIVDVSAAPVALHAPHARQSSTLILGAQGFTAGVSWGRLPPFDFVPTPLTLSAGPSGLPGTRLYVSRVRKLFAPQGAVQPPLLLIGEQGSGTLLMGEQHVPFAIAGLGDLHDVAGNDLTTYIVGAGGTILHGAIRGAQSEMIHEVIYGAK